MKNILKKIILNLLTIAAVSHFAPGLTYNHNFTTLLVAATVLSLANAFLKPILKLLLLPINVITLGLMGWLVNVLILYIVTQLVPGFDVVAFTIGLGQTSLVFSRFWAFIIISLILNLFGSLIGWIIE